MKVRIAHCTVCRGYRGRALSLAEELRRRFGAAVEVVEGGLGQFDVEVDDALIVSRGVGLSRMKPLRPPAVDRVIAVIERREAAGQGRPNGAMPRGHARAFGPEDAKRFYDRLGAWQDAQFYENVALDRLVDRAGFERASAVFELGCGTGRLASRLFEEKLGENARYLGIDISTTMVDLAKRRLARWGARAEVRQADGATNLPCGDATFDRFVAAYVLDLLPEDVIGTVLGEARRMLVPGGRLCTVALTEGVGVGSRLLSSAWKGLHALDPRLVGGCRPLRVADLLDRDSWRIDDAEVVCSWGICSEIVIAIPV